MDARNVHATGDIPVVGELLGGFGTEAVLQRTFQKKRRRGRSRGRHCPALFLAVALIGTAVRLR
ncbi:MAG TPA: hypothetical protein VHX16_12410 [Chloroflexota bacterium]|nr:hypothetical protein [Chloroflexota bacterium]